MMKKNKVVSFLIIDVFLFVLSGWALMSCSLEETPASFTDSNHYYQNAAQCQTVLNACYIPLKSIYSYTYMLVTEGTSDVLYNNGATLDCQLDISPSQPRFGTTMWTQGYKGVMYCNAAIAGIRRANLTDEERIRLLGEGLIMRAYYYWFLTCTFGDVPFYTQDVANDEELLRVAKLGRMPARETRDSLIHELQRVVPKMHQVRSCEEDNNHVGAAMGWMMIAKLAQWNEEWEISRDAITHLEDIYGNLSQYPLKDVMFRNKNTKESIFEIQFLYDNTGLKVYTSVASICTPPHGTGYYYDGVEIPELGQNATTWSSMRPTLYYVQNLMAPNSGDARLDLNMAWSYNGKNFASVSVVPWLGPKFWCPNMQNNNDGNNQKVFRYADALLMQAENYFRLGDNTTAIRYLNMTRTRAKIGDYKYRNDESLLEEIQDERGRELLGEFQRKYDLVRWGIYYERVSDYNNNPSLIRNLRRCHQYYPIPDTEVAKSEGVLDNKAYAAEGL